MSNCKLALRIRIIGPRCPARSPHTGAQCQREIGHMGTLRSDHNGEGGIFEMHSSDLGAGTEGWWDPITYTDLFSRVAITLDGLDNIRVLLSMLAPGAISF